MAAATNTITAVDLCTGLDIEFVRNFNGDIDRLGELLGMFEVDTRQAGTALYQYEVTGTLNSTTPGEGEATPLSKYTLDKTPVGELAPKRYAKVTTAEGILKSGYENAISKTDKKFGNQLRKSVWDSFFTFLGNGTGKAEGATLQATLAKADATLEDALETNGDAGASLVHFVNRQDIADYLATADITTQTAFGMTYIQSFLGVENIFVTNAVAAGTLYVTAVENIHIYGIDFSALGDAGLAYETDASGLIGIHHVADYDKGSAETFAMLGMDVIPEVKDYIVKGTIKAASTAATGK